MRVFANSFAITPRNAYRLAGVIGVLGAAGLFYQHDETQSVSPVGVTERLLDTQVYSQKQLRFVENQGQAGVSAKYHVQWAGHTVLFHEDKVILKRDESESARNEIVLRFSGAKQNPAVKGQEKLPGVAHFYKGQDPNKWQTNVPTYKSVSYSDLYPGIDMAYIGRNNQLESEFYVAAGVDYHQILISYDGVQSKTIRADGSLVLETELGELIEKAPFAYQDIDGVRVEVEAEYRILADASVGFELSSYDTNLPLVIDPQLAFITVIPGVGGEWASAVVQDASGNIIAAGGGNRFFPATDVIVASNHAGGSGNDGLLVKTDSAGVIIYSALFGGTKLDYFNDIATDASGSLYLTGLTSSRDFPVLNPVQETRSGGEDAFLVILDSTGVLMYGTYLGGIKRDWGEGIALDASGNIYIGGSTESSDFPTMNAFQPTFLGAPSSSPFPADIFLTKFNPLGQLVYSTFLGGSQADRLAALAVTDSGELTVAGGTLSTDFPVMRAFQDTLGGVNWGIGDIFVSRLNAVGDSLVYSTYIGGSKQDWATDLALGMDGSAYVSGGSASPGFPIVNGLSLPETDSTDGILVCLDNVGQPIYSVRSNIPGSDAFDAVAVDTSANAFPVGVWRDSVRFYQKTVDSALEVNFQVAAAGHNVNGVYLINQTMSVASAFFAASPAISPTIGAQSNATRTMSPSQMGIMHFWNLAVLATYIGEGWNLSLDNWELTVNYDFGDGKLLLNADQNGKIAINGQSSELNADAVKEVIVEASIGDDEIDLRLVTSNDFPSIISTDVSAGAGADIVWASLSQNVRNLIHTGAGNDIIYATLWSDFLSSILNGGSGADLYSLLGGAGNGAPPSGSTAPVTARSVALPITIVDSSGVDTLSFTDYAVGITLDLDLQTASQQIDDNGVEIILDGVFEVVHGSAFDDVITLAPLLSTLRHIDGANGSDILNITSVGALSVDDGSTIRTPGYADITYTNVETVNLPIVTDIDNDDSPLPFTFMLNQNYPNPFNPTTVISYSIPARMEVTVTISNVLGRQVKLFTLGEQSAGQYNITWDGTDSHGVAVASGMYFYRITAGDLSSARKMVLLK